MFTLVSLVDQLQLLDSVGLGFVSNEDLQVQNGPVGLVIDQTRLLTYLHHLIFE